jgi:hypothetical protein
LLIFSSLTPVARLQPFFIQLCYIKFFFNATIDN